jgi:hypothetical protein
MDRQYSVPDPTPPHPTHAHSIEYLCPLHSVTSRATVHCQRSVGTRTVTPPPPPPVHLTDTPHYLPPIRTSDTSGSRTPGLLVTSKELVLKAQPYIPPPPPPTHTHTRCECCWHHACVYTHEAQFFISPFLSFDASSDMLTMRLAFSRCHLSLTHTYAHILACTSDLQRWHRPVRWRP